MLKPNHFVLGCDPGLSGALSVYEPYRKWLIAVTQLPRNKVGLDLVALREWLIKLSPRGRMAYATLEAQNGRPGQDTGSQFRFAWACGSLEGLFHGLHIPVVKVDSAVWKCQMHLSSDKALSRKMAQKLFPDDAGEFCRVRDDDKAESVLLAVYGSLFIPTPEECRGMVIEEKSSAFGR